MIPASEMCAIVLSFKRTQNIPLICQTLDTIGFDKIVIADNISSGSDENIQAAMDSCSRVQLADCGTSGLPEDNPRTASRYIIAQYMTRGPVFVQDDDYVVTEVGFRRLSTAYNGRRPVVSLPDWRVQGPGLPFIDVGYGSIFDSRLSEAVFKILYSSFGNQGRLVVQNADRCFTVMVGEWDTVAANNNTVTRIVDARGTYSDMDENAIHLQDGYWEQTTEVVSKCLMLKSNVEELLSCYGYKTLLEFLSRTNYGQSQKEVLDSLTFTME